MEFDFWPMVGIAAALLTTFGFVPQILKMIQHKNVHGVSLATFFQFMAGVSLWAAYGWHLNDPILIFANIVTFITLAIAIILYFKFHSKQVKSK